MKDYHDFDLKCNVILLADVFDKIRKNSLKNYGLCPSHYLSASALSWDAMLNMTKVEHVHILLKNPREVEFLIFPIDIVKPAISI